RGVPCPAARLVGPDDRDAADGAAPKGGPSAVGEDRPQLRGRAVGRLRVRARAGTGGWEPRGDIPRDPAAPSTDAAWPRRVGPDPPRPAGGRSAAARRLGCRGPRGRTAGLRLRPALPGRRIAAWRGPGAPLAAHRL